MAAEFDSARRVPSANQPSSSGAPPGGIDIRIGRSDPGSELRARTGAGSGAGATGTVVAVLETLAAADGAATATGAAD
ncbi:MAG: hypothetical protein ACOYM9_12825 [Bradymonadia bacterium]